MAPITRRFGSGKEAMAWLADNGSSARKTPAQLDAEIARALEKPRASARATKPAARSGGNGGNMTPAKFLASLPPAHTRRGPSSVGTGVIAKTIKAEVAQAAAAGALPHGTKVSASTDHNSINVRVTAWEGAVFSDKYIEHLMDPTGTAWDRDEQESYRRGGNYEESGFDPRLTSSLNRALQTIEKIANRHNYNNSDIQSDYFDVGYYLNVSARPVEDLAANAIKLESNKEFGKLIEQGRIAAKAVGAAATAAICGHTDLRMADAYCIERLIKLADRAKGRPVAYDKRRRGWYPAG